MPDTEIASMPISICHHYYMHFPKHFYKCIPSNFYPSPPPKTHQILLSCVSLIGLFCMHIFYFEFLELSTWGFKVLDPIVSA